MRLQIKAGFIIISRLVKNVLIYEFEGERIKSMKNYLDMMTMMSQLGLAG